MPQPLMDDREIRRRHAGDLGAGAHGPTFLNWAAEPAMEQRKSTGAKVMLSCW